MSIVGGICGLASAAAALRHFDSVTVIERDDLTGARIADEPDPVQTEKRRKGVQQFIQPHVLLAGGARALDRLVPGFLVELQSRGALSYDAGEGFRCFDFGCGLGAGGAAGHRASGLTIYAASRRLISETLQDLVVAQGGPRLTLLDRTKVSGLAWEGGAVVGAVLGSGATLRGDLVIVADGRRSQLPHWLKEGGVELPEPLKVDCRMSYVARWMRLPAGFDPGAEFFSAVANGRPALSRGGMAMAIEGGAAQFTLTGFEGEVAPMDHAGWLRYAASLPDPAIHDLARRCEPAGPITRFASAPNLHRRYHEGSHPEGVVALGDAAMALSPAYGQGMTVAAQGAEALGAWLAGVRGGAAAARRPSQVKAFQQKLERGMQGAWRAACAEDMGWKGTEVRGPVAPPPGGLWGRYMAAVMAAARSDPAVWAAVLEVAQLEAPASALYAPGVAARVARAALFGGGASPAPLPLEHAGGAVL